MTTEAKKARAQVMILFLGLIFFSFGVGSELSLYGQISGGGNAISGHVFGSQRQPVNDVYVELLDEFGRSLQRIRTTGGRYSFRGMPQGNYRIRVLPYGTDYLEQEQGVEIRNYVRSTPGGGVAVSGFVHEQIDFYLRSRRIESPGINEAIFVQEVPEDAKKLYTRAIKSLDEKKEKEGLEDLKSAIEIFPKYYAALERLGIEYVRLGHFDAARILLRIAVDVNPRSYKGWFYLASSLYALKSYSQGLEAINKAIEISPNSVEAYLASGMLLRQSKNFVEAEKHLLKANELAKNSGTGFAQIHFQLALLYGNDLKRYRDAAKELKLFLKAQPDSKDAENIKRKIKEFEDKAQGG
jgi:tetratricopeptide (TPR) repeat protein